MNRELLDRWCERGILFLVLAILVFAPLAMGAVGEWEFLVVQSLTIGVMLLWLGRLWFGARPQLLWPPICWAVIAFALYAVIRYLTADIEYAARQEMVQVLIYAFLFLAIVNNVHRQEPGRIIAFALVFLAMAISFYALYQFITDSNKVWTYLKPYEHRGTGTFISPNNLGGFLELILPVGLAFTLLSRAKILTKVFLGYASLMICTGIAVTLSRGSWIATGLSLFVFFLILVFHRRYRLPAFLFAALMISAGVFLIPKYHLFQHRAQQLLTPGGEVNDDARFELWKPAYQLWRENPWWGIGPNHFDYRFGKYRPKDIPLSPDRVHNDYLNTLTDWGIVGITLVASAWLLLFVGICKTWKRVREGEADLGGRQSNKFALLLGASIGLLAILFHSVVDFNMHIPSNALVTITLMALVSGYLRFATDRYWFGARLWMRAALSLALVAGIFYLTWQGVRSGREYAWLARAEIAENSTARIEALQNAFAADPRNFETAFQIGESLRRESWIGRESDYRELANEAMRWFERGMKLNPYDDRNYVGCGQCLDWLGEHAKAEPYFLHAVELEPNGYFTVAYMGWHYVQIEDYAAALVWLERSRRLNWRDNDIADSWTVLAKERLMEKAAGPPQNPLRHLK